MLILESLKYIYNNAIIRVTKTAIARYLILWLILFSILLGIFVIQNLWNSNDARSFDQHIYSLSTKNVNLELESLTPWDHFEATRSNDPYANISFAFFYDPDCQCTYEAMDELSKIENKYKSIKQYWYNLTYNENKTSFINFTYKDAYNVPDYIRIDPPLIFIGDYYFHHEEITFENVSAVIELYKGKNVPLWPDWELTWTMHVAFFYNLDRVEVTGILENVEQIKSAWNRERIHIIIHNYSLANPTNKLLLDNYFVEYDLSEVTIFDRPNELYAAIFIDNDFILNSEITYDSLNNTVTKYSGRNTALPDIKPDITGGKICVIFFYSPTCGDCHTARNILEDLKAKYSELNVKEYNIADPDPDNLILQLSYYDYYAVPEGKQGTLAVFIGDQYFVKDDIYNGNFRSDLEKQIKRYKDGCACPDVESDEDIVIERFTGFTFAAVLFAGLVDSINPCAIATLIFFITYLSATGRAKREVLMIGIAYTLGVFITYMALGLGLYNLIAVSVRELEFFSILLYPIIAIITIIFGIYSLYDFNKVRKGKKEEMKLKLPNTIKRLIGRVIKHHVKLRYFALIAIITGFLISLLEFLCTGQIYLPTISLVARTVPEYHAQAIFLLFLYNLMFVVPLIIVFLAVYNGMKSEQLQDFLIKNRALIKLLTAIVFFVLAAFLIWYSMGVVG